jgi:hypothetical protein
MAIRLPKDYRLELEYRVEGLSSGTLGGTALEIQGFDNGLLQEWKSKMKRHGQSEGNTWKLMSERVWLRLTHPIGEGRKLPQESTTIIHLF